MYDIRKEYINIENYSPFCHINEVSEEYQKDPFLLPIVKIDDDNVPIHPDTFHDLNINPDHIVSKVKVYPTASFRTVYLPSENIFIKLPLLRRITRGVRDITNIKLDMSKEASRLLSGVNIDGFYFLKEIPVYGKEEIYNYIIREIQYEGMMPLFYVIKTKHFPKNKMLEFIENLLNVWFELASRNLYLELHTQNTLVDDALNIYYRDLRDVKSVGNRLLDIGLSIPETNSLCFDKTVCNQNLDHIFRYYEDFTDNERNYISNYIKQKIEEYDMEFPNYSIMYPLDRPDKVPIKIPLISYRK